MLFFFFFLLFGMIGFDIRSRTDGNFSGDGDLSEGDQKRQKIIPRLKTFIVQITFVSIIPFRTILDGQHGVKSGNSEVLIALDTILQHCNAKRCILIQQKLLLAIKTILTFFPPFFSLIGIALCFANLTFPTR